MTKGDDPEFAFAFGPAGLTPFNSLKYTSEPERIWSSFALIMRCVTAARCSLFGEADAKRSL